MYGMIVNMIKKSDNEDKKWPLNERVEVEWIDSCTNGVWAPPSYHITESKPTTCRSIGYILVEDTKKIVVAQSMSLNTGNICDTMSIPRVAVLKIKRIKGLDN